MKEQTFKLDESQIKFLELCQNYGFKDPSELVRIAIQRLKLALETQGKRILSSTPNMLQLDQTNFLCSLL